MEKEMLSLPSSLVLQSGSLNRLVQKVCVCVCATAIETVLISLNVADHFDDGGH